MKQQIRKFVFETNSSTQHALVINSQYEDRKIADGVPEGVKLPDTIQLRELNWKEMDELTFYTVENRLLWLYNSIINLMYENKGYIIRFLMWLQKLNIKFELTELEDFCYQDCPYDFIEQIMENEKRFMAFVFADDVLYDSYQDDCGSYEEQMAWEDAIEDFSESHKATFTLRTRC